MPAANPPQANSCVRGWLRIFLFALAICWLPVAAHADIVYHVTLDTTGLEALQNPDTSVINPGTGLPNLFSVDIQLNTTGAVPGNHTATFSNFNFGSGSPYDDSLVILTPIGGASGALSSSVMIDDNSFAQNDFTEQFVAGDTLTFDLTVNSGIVGTDLLFFRILDQNLNPILTDDPSGINSSLLTIDFEATTPNAQTFPTSPGAVDGNGDPITIPAPNAPAETPTGDVPEPASFTLLAIGLVGWIARRRRSPGA